jgi:hypothetical protein
MSVRDVVRRWLQIPPQEGPTDPPVVYKVVELPNPRPMFSEKESREALVTLSAHPGFTVLTQRLAAQNALLRSKLVSEHHKDMRSVDFLQAGVYWSNWLTQELTRVTTKQEVLYKDAMDEELEAFRAIDATIERIT